MRIYNLTNELKGVFPLDTSDYQRLLDIFNFGGLPLFIHYFLKWQAEDDDPFKFSPAAVFSILDHVIRRTVAFGKPVEAITIPEIVEGKLKCGIAPAMVGRRTIITNMDQLVRCGLVIKIRFRQSISQRVLYGVNFQFMLFWTYHKWNEDLDDSRPKALAARRLYERIESIYERACNWKGDFDRLAGLKNPLPDFDSLLVPWRED